MLEINLLPPPKGPDSEMKKMLSPSIAYFLELAFERARCSQTKDGMILWGRIWASLLHLRHEYLQPGFSRADNFAERFILEGDEELFVHILHND